MNTLIVDDHALVLEGLKLVLRKPEPNVNVMESADLPSAMEMATELTGSGAPLDLAILDFRMPGMNGSAGIETFCAQFSDTPVIVLSGQYRRQDVLECFRRGASGFIPKALGTKAMMNAIELVLGGGKFLPADILAGARRERRLAKRRSDARCPQSTPPSDQTRARRARRTG